MKLHLARHSYHPVCTMGWFHVAGERFATIEPPWRQNRVNESCIPEGTYKIEPYTSIKFPQCWEVLDVPDRHSILIHPGNFPKDTTGCIVVGTEPSRSGLCVLQSAAAMVILREILAGASNMTITIDYQRG